MFHVHSWGHPDHTAGHCHLSQLPDVNPRVDSLLKASWDRSNLPTLQTRVCLNLRFRSARKVTMGGVWVSFSPFFHLHKI